MGLTINSLQLIWNSLPELMGGAWITLKLTVLSLGLGLIIAIPVSFAQIYGTTFIRRLVSVYERVLRSIPLLVILFLIFYGFPSMGLRLPAFMAAVIGIGLRSSAYQSQIFRGAIQSIGDSQLKAALSLGMSRGQAFINIILPQAIRIVIPPWANEFTIVLKDSSLAFALSVVELMRQGRYIMSTSVNPMPILLTIAAIYFVMAFAINIILGQFENKLQIPGFGVKGEAR